MVKIGWGSGLAGFYGRLESMHANYTLFRATGEALRAKVDLGFISYATPMEEALMAQRSSPDMTHTVRVRAGDTLPLLCQQIYRDASRYLEIARLNGLDGFRALRAGHRAAVPADALMAASPLTGASGEPVSAHDQERRQRRIPDSVEVRVGHRPGRDELRIPEALIVLADGDAADARAFPLADAAPFVPGRGHRDRRRLRRGDARRRSSRASSWRCGCASTATTGRGWR